MEIFNITPQTTVPSAVPAVAAVPAAVLSAQDAVEVGAAPHTAPVPPHTHTPLRQTFEVPVPSPVQCASVKH